MDPPVSLLLFRGFGSERQICVSGQVVLGRGLPGHMEPADRGPWGRLRLRLRQVLRLVVSQRVPVARLQVRWGAGRAEELITDSHGYFFRCLAPGAEPPVGDAWGSYRVEILEPTQAEPVADEAQVLMASPRARRVIVSDIDDTVIFTGVSNKIAMLWRLFVQGADQRVPFPGIAPLYQGLQRGAGDGREDNPMIYLSRSPWSLYPALEALFQMHRIPEGPVLLLRDWGITLRHPFPRRAPEHKRDMLTRIASVYPDLPLVLIGDSGQRDPELYAAFARRHPDRVTGICIRRLRASRSRHRELERLRRQTESLGIPWMGVSDTVELARFMSGRGWIPPGDLPRVGEHFREGTT